MRTIQKSISLEPMTSRLPSVWPAYYDNILYYFNDEDLKEREWVYTSNWGLIPMNIIVNHNPNEIDMSDSEKRPKKWDTYSLPQFCSACCHCYGEYIDENGEPNHIDSKQNPYYYDSLCEDEGYFILSFENLSKWYCFFNEYYNLLERYGHCNRVYTSAEDYYNYESNTKYADQMKYGGDKQTYLDLDKEFAEKGGRVEVLIFNKDTSEYTPMTPKEAHDETRDDRMAMIDVYDVGFFKWINENVVPSFIIPMKYKDFWKRDTLFYPDVIRWLAWFSTRLDYETNAEYKKGENGELDTWNCKSENVKDCCDCEEYFNRGGREMYDKLKEWYDEVQKKIIENKELISGVTNCFVPTMIIPTELQISIDDLGEKSIFSSEFELGIDYRTGTDLTSTMNIKGGTVVTMDGNSMILKNGQGYTFDDVYMEKFATKCNTCGYEGSFSQVCPKCGSKDIDTMDWEAYTNKYIRENTNEFYVNTVKYFSYDEDNIKYTSSEMSLTQATIDLEWQMSKKYKITESENGWILINGILYPINDAEYATYDKVNTYLGNKRYMIFRDEWTRTPYTYINGKQIYAEYYEPTRQFYFPFFKNESTSPFISCSGKTFNIKEYKTFERDTLGDKIFYINYNDNMFEVVANTLIIDGIEYYRVKSYATDNKGENIYQTYDGVIRSGETMAELDNVVIETNAEYFDNKPYMRVFCPFEVKLYAADEINGTTVSKLADLRLYNVLVDDIGNDIDGIYDIRKANIKNHQPPEGSELELLYQVGNTANITRFSNTKEDLDNIEDDKNYFVGDIIKEMEFYYKETDDTIPYQVVRKVILGSDDKIHFYKKKEDGTYEEYKQVESGYTSLSAITECAEEKKTLEEMEEETHVFYDDVFCDVVYYVGATLVRRKGKNFNLSYDDQICNYGVEYKETVRFVKENREYYLSKQKKIFNVIPMIREKIFTHSISYPIYVYKLTQELETIYDTEYDTSYSVPKAEFKFKINIYSGGTSTFDEKFSKDMAKHNNMQVFPTFREEYRMGMASIENVDSDIYINRGINAAFERHLKLQEVKTLEALEQYSNGYFKIMDN